jgi:hypothetical protein
MKNNQRGAGVQRNSPLASVFAAAVEQYVASLIVSGGAQRALSDTRKRVTAQDVVNFVRNDKGLCGVFSDVSIFLTDETCKGS